MTDHQVYNIGTDGTDLQQLTVLGDNPAPNYSADGEWIAFSPFREGNNEIYRKRTDGSVQTRLTFDPRKDWQPRWGR